MGVVARAVCLSLLLVAAGCAGIPGDGRNPGRKSSLTPPERPAEFNDSSAKSYALAYERYFLKTYLADRYENGEFGVGCCATARDAGVVAEKSGTYYVQVQYPYYYSTSAGETDAVSRALYVLSETTNRISLDSRVVRVEDPYSGPNQSTNANPPTIWVVNTRDGAQEVSVSLRHEGQDEVAFTRSLELAANRSVKFSGVVSRTGEYTLTFDGERETLTFEYANVEVNYTDVESAPGNVFILVTDDGTTIHTAPRNL